MKHNSVIANLVIELWQSIPYKLIILIVYLLGFVYLTLPSPAFPELSRSGRSDEPGDTWQHPDQKGYYSNLSRSEVLKDIESQFHIKFMGIEIPNYRLNYRPEDAGDLVRDQLQSYYLEEIVIPFRESIFVNGWEPKNSPQYRLLPDKSKSDLFLHGVPYDAKITLRPVNSPVWARLLIWTLLFPATYLVYLSFKKTLTSIK